MNKFWMFIHNVIAHPLMALSFYSKWADNFHDWTAKKAFG